MIYLDEEATRRLDEEAEQDGISRSAWVRRAVQSRLDAHLPARFFEVLGAREDDREPEEILRDIRVEAPERAVQDAATWDRQIEADARTGRLDDLAEQALAAHRRGASREI